MTSPSQTLRYLAHLSDGVVKHSAGVVGSLANQLHFPRTRRQTQVGRTQFHHLLRYLREDRPTFLPAVQRTGEILCDVYRNRIIDRQPRQQCKHTLISQLSQMDCEMLHVS